MSSASVMIAIECRSAAGRWFSLMDMNRDYYNWPELYGKSQSNRSTTAVLCHRESYFIDNGAISPKYEIINCARPG